jgi:hypothetical protein
MVAKPGAHLVPLLFSDGAAPVETNKSLPFLIATTTKVKVIGFDDLGDELVKKSVQVLFAKVFGEVEANMEPHFLEFTHIQFLAKAFSHPVPF